MLTNVLLVLVFVPFKVHIGSLVGCHLASKAVADPCAVYMKAILQCETG